MTRAIDPIKLKAATEHLEWVLRQYPESKDVQNLLRALSPLIEDVKAGMLTQPIESMMKVPGAYNFSDGLYVPFRSPDVGDAYAKFVTELEGGITEEEEELQREADALKKSIHKEGKS
jgi:hypothetical protein